MAEVKKTEDRIRERDDAANPRRTDDHAISTKTNTIYETQAGGQIMTCNSRLGHLPWRRKRCPSAAPNNDDAYLDNVGAYPVQSSSRRDVLSNPELSTCSRARQVPANPIELSTCAKNCHIDRDRRARQVPVNPIELGTRNENNSVVRDGRAGQSHLNPELDAVDGRNGRVERKLDEPSTGAESRQVAVAKPELSTHTPAVPPEGRQHDQSAREPNRGRH